MYPVMPRAETLGATERMIGSWLKKSGRRQDIVLASKIAGPSMHATWIRNGESNFDRKNLRAAIEGSLQRLQTDYLDLYQLHWPSRNVPVFGQQFFDPQRERAHVPMEESLIALQELIDEGKVRHIGISNESAWGVTRFCAIAEQKGLPRIVSVQNAYHLANRQFESGVDEACFRENVSLLGYSPLAFGQLTGKYIDQPTAHGRLTIFPPTWSPRYLRPRVVEATKRYMKIAKDNGMTVTQLALAWCYTRSFVASTIIGATSVSQLKSNIDAYEIKLSEDVVNAVNEVHLEFTDPGM
jgi:aryl-alcohol dehydrogenase-like predicted oxidoreductase